MRCTNCGKKLKKKSSFCIKCGAKVPPIPKKDKKEKRKKKRSKAKIVIPFFTILILAILSFLLFGGNKVPEKIRDLKGYSYLTGMVKEKLPEDVRLPFDLPDKFPFDFSFKLPFELPNPGNPLSDSEIPDKKKIMEDLAAYEGGEKTSVAGVDNKIVINDKNLYTDISSDWKHSKVKVLEHYTDVKAGTDIVVVYLELENEFVKMAGTKEIMYQYNGQTKEWEPIAVSKLTCLSIEPVSEQL